MFARTVVVVCPRCGRVSGVWIGRLVIELFPYCSGVAVMTKRVLKVLALKYAFIGLSFVD